MKNPFLVGDKIYLRGLTLHDLDGNYINWLNDAIICKYNSHHVFPYNRENAENYIKDAYHSKNKLALAIVLKKNDLHIGNISLQNINYINQSAEFAIIAGEKKYWGKGYSKEAASLIIKHGFMELNLHRIYCGTSDDNIPMQKLALSIGMTDEGRSNDALFKHGRYVDIINYGILRDVFIKHNRSQGSGVRKNAKRSGRKKS
tara:strand:+ start:8906 stop:9511 length:606 start_codon:yes stop_codon:yes gene_type:complete